MRMCAGWLEPGVPPVRSDRQIALRIAGLGIIPAGGQAVETVGEPSEAGRFGYTVNHWSRANVPGLPPILRMENARRSGSAGGEPDLVFAARDKRGVAGGEGPFVGKCGRRRTARPSLPAISSLCQDHESPRPPGRRAPLRCLHPKMPGHRRSRPHPDSKITATSARPHPRSCKFGICHPARYS